MLELERDILDGMPTTGPTDPIAFYRRPVVGWLFRERINRGLRLLGERHFDRALEVGYGAGALQLVIDRVTDELHGIDLDADPDEVMATLAGRGLHSKLVRGDVCEMPYEDRTFDLVVCFSVIEHLHAYRQALAEIRRVLQPGGWLLLGMPSVNLTMEVGFRAIGFKGIEDHHVTTPAQVEAAFDAAGLSVVRRDFLDVPGPRPFGLRLYHDWLLERS